MYDSFCCHDELSVHAYVQGLCLSCSKWSYIFCLLPGLTGQV